MCEFHFSEYVVLIVYVEATAEVQYLNTYRTYKCSIYYIFQWKISLTLFTFLRELWNTFSTYWQYKVWVLSVCLEDGRFTVLIGRSDAMQWSWSKSFSPASLCFWTVNVALATAITSSSDLSLQVEDPFTTGKSIFWCSQPLWWSSKNMKGLITQFIIKDMS